jgi:hypothetical protein
MTDFVFLIANKMLCRFFEGRKQQEDQQVIKY